MRRQMALVALLALLSGCPVPQRQDVPNPQQSLKEPTTGRKYSLYVPSYYSADHKWPLVVTLHGTYGWDGHVRQVKEWKYLAEQKGFIVAAPFLKSVQGILPRFKKPWFKNLASDEKAILALLDELIPKYSIDPNAVLLSGFSAGGYPMYHVGLRNPTRFSMLIARACNSSISLFERIKFTDETRKLPVMIFWGKDDLKPIQDQSWEAFAYLRGRRKCFKTRKREIEGGHLRRPDIAYGLWEPHLPAEYKRPSEQQ